LLSAVLIARVHCMDPVNDATASDIQITVIRSAKAAVLRWLIVRSFDVAKVFAFGIEYLNAGRGCGKSISLTVHAKTIGAAHGSVIGFFLQCVLAEVLAVLQT